MSRNNNSTHYRRGNIFLIGMMGVGKTTLGKLMASTMSRRFVDCDEAIESATGSSIERIFGLAGEAAFRGLEEQTLGRLVQCDNTILSTGGGVVLSAANRAALRANGYVVYLSAPLSKLLARVQGANLDHRPMLQADDVEQQLRALLAQRAPLYRETADTVIAVGNVPAAKLAQRIIQRYIKAGGEYEG